MSFIVPDSVFVTVEKNSCKGLEPKNFSFAKYVLGGSEVQEIARQAYSQPGYPKSILRGSKTKVIALQAHLKRRPGRPRKVSYNLVI